MSETRHRVLDSPTAVLPPQPVSRVPAHGKNDGVLTIFKGLLEVIVIGTFIATFLVEAAPISSGSMEPTMHVGDALLVDRQAFGPMGVLDHILPIEGIRRGDLVVFYYPPDPARTLVKRVVGLPGERLRLREGQVYIDGAALEEPYAFRSSAQPDSFRDDFPSLRSADPNADPLWWAQLRRILHDGEITVPDGQYFVLGDNRNNSEDSRYWGFVPRDKIVGRPLMVYFTTHGNAPEASVGQRLRSALHQVRVLR